MHEAAREHETLQQALAKVFTGRFESYLRKVAVAPPDAPDLVPGREIAAPGRLERLCEVLAAEQGCRDRRVLLSLWSRLYADIVIPATVVASLAFDRALPVGLDEVRFAVDGNGKLLRLVLVHGGTPLPPDSDPVTRFTTLVAENLGPLVEAASRQGAVPPRLLWSNLASHFEWTSTVLVQLGAIPPERAAPVEALLAERGWPAGPIRALAEALSPEGRNHHGMRWRRACCIRYLIPALAGAYCSNCPIVRPDVRERRLARQR